MSYHLKVSICCCWNLSGGKLFQQRLLCQVYSVSSEKCEPLQTLQMETSLGRLPPTQDGYTFANLGSVPAVPMARITSIEEREQVPNAGLFKLCHRMDIKCPPRCLISSWWTYFRRFWKLKEVGLVEESRSLGLRADLWKLCLAPGVFVTLWFLSIR